MYNSYSEWNSCINNSEDLDGYEDIYNPGVGSVFTTNQFHELTLPARTTIGDEYIWVAPEVEEDGIHSTQKLFEGLNSTQACNELGYSEASNYWNSSYREYLSNSQVPNQKIYSNVDQASLNVDDTFFISNNCDIASSDSSSVSHTSTLHGVWVVPNRDNDTNLVLNKSKFEHSSSDNVSSSVETSNSEIRRRFHFSRQKSDMMVDGTRIKSNSSDKCKNDDEISMLVASGGAPLGRLDEIGGVEWYPERQSWKVVGHTGISWCVRRKTWRVWFITSGGTRATRSFNPKEHGTVAAALKVAIEFLEHKRAEKSPTQKNLRGRARRSNLCSNSFVDGFSKSNSLSLNESTYKHANNLIN
ncbi:AP2 domain-containing [Cryptosporidium sp. chipmunk genotype I]|uniref:AP2 domain-containing n=1 Tax=Cryptosporidium sp. chipmunk genotype I TaxID=1280935 RepID=UPI00351A57BB|nr:AP2 domain-containing [Cryptosporidium sp. chipmunk genotype I]